MEAIEQRLVDQRLVDLDGTPDKSPARRQRAARRLAGRGEGGGGVAGLELFRYVGGPNAHVLPVPMMNIINGGAHADTSVDVQEFMIAPVGADSFREALRWGAEVYHALKSVLKAEGLATGLGDEGGFAPDLPGTRAALDLIAEAVEKAGFTLGRDIVLALDVAATEFYTDGVYPTRAQQAVVGGVRGGVRRAGRRVPDGVDRGPVGRGRLGRLGRVTEQLGRRCRSWATTCSSPTRAARGRHRPRRRERAAGEGQPDRHALRDARRVTLAHSSGTAA